LGRKGDCLLPLPHEYKKKKTMGKKRGKNTYHTFLRKGGGSLTSKGENRKFY